MNWSLFVLLVMVGLLLLFVGTAAIHRGHPWLCKIGVHGHGFVDRLGPEVNHVLQWFEWDHYCPHCKELKRRQRFEWNGDDFIEVQKQ